jgi:hypothetical protein
MYTQSAVAADDRRKKRRRKTFGVVAAVLAVVVALGSVVVWAVNGSSSGGGSRKAGDAPSRLDVRETVEKRPASATGALAFRFSADDLAPGEEHDMPGMWATDKILAKGINRTLLGFAIGTDSAAGDEVWSIRLDGPICATTTRVSVENRTAVLFAGSTAKSAPCDRVAFVDLDDGRTLWTGKITPERSSGASDASDRYALRPPTVTLTHGTVVVTWGGGTDAYAMDGGKRLWRSESTDKCVHTGAGGGKALLIRLSCQDRSDPGGQASYRVRKVDARTGHTAWTYAVAKNVTDVRVVSSDPAVVAVSAGDVGITDILSLDEHGRYLATIRVQKGKYVAECADQADYFSVEDCPSIVVGDGQVFVRSAEQGDLVNNANWIVGFDLRTGRTVKKFDSGRDALLYPLRMSGGRLLALRESSDHLSPMALMSLDPATGKVTPYLYFDLPSDAWTLTTQTSNDIRVEDGRIFFGARTATGPEQKTWQWLVVGLESVTRRAESLSTPKPEPKPGR